MTIEIQTLNPKRSNIAFCYSTKDRPELTKQTLVPILEDGGAFDLYWIDGSITGSGNAVIDLYKTHSKICEVHKYVYGGADVAIVYSLSLLLEKGYEYIGLIENDVLLEKGWLAKLLDLHNWGVADGLKIGAVSARCYQPRIHIPRDNYAVMKNIGAGMLLLTKDAVEHILDNFHTGPVGEPSFLFTNYTGIQGICPWQMNQIPEEKQTNKWYTCADWFFEASLLPYGLASLACTPSMAKNIDEADQDPIQTEPTKTDPEFDWQEFTNKINQNSNFSVDVVYNLMPNYDPIYKEWRAFPHQLIKVFGDTFSNGWQLKWNQFYGPFSMVTTQNGAKLKLNFNSSNLKIIYTNPKEEAQVFIKSKITDEALILKPSTQMLQLNVTYPFPGPHDVELFFDRPGIIIHGILYDAPQNWFRSKYPLRYRDLALYIG